MTIFAYGVAGWPLLVGVYGIVRSHDAIHAVDSLSIAQSGSYVLLVAVGYQRGGVPRSSAPRYCRRPRSSIRSCRPSRSPMSSCRPR